MKCEIAGCEELAEYIINDIGCACKECMKEVLDDLQLDEEEDVKRI